MLAENTVGGCGEVTRPYSKRIYVIKKKHVDGGLKKMCSIPKQLCKLDFGDQWGLRMDTVND